MQKEIQKFLVEQNPHWTGEKRKENISRDVFEKLQQYIPLRQAITISGIRRCGKSSLLMQTLYYLIDTGIHPKNILFINLEQPYFLPHHCNPQYLKEIIEQYKILMNPSGKIFVLFDEIQFFTDWQVFVKSEYEQADIKFFLTGSNSSLLSADLNTLLSGRSLNIHLTPFSFSEFLRYKNIPHETDFEKISKKQDIVTACQEYLQWGGFFEVFSVKNPEIKKDILQAYIKNILYQDIIPRYSLRNAEQVEILFYYLIANVTTLINYTKLAKMLEVTPKTIQEYISYFEDVFLLHRIPKFHTKYAEQVKAKKKIYALDNGFLQLSFHNRNEYGKILENIVGITLLQQNSSVHYWRDTYEVDFVTEKNIFQVSWDMGDSKTFDREKKSLDKGLQKFPDKKGVFITQPFSNMRDDNEVIALENFLLE